ncbi:phasin family protein [Methylocystis sp. 9N]|uniref:Phasin family protein n=1 Tax=Methylocystis borbori TaxID=3118750 RepID=A0ABU7XI12_9HYPH
MATPTNASPKSKPAPAETPAVAETLTETAPAPVIPPAAAPATASPAAPAAPPVAAPTTALTTVASQIVAPDAAGETFDPALWQKKSFDLWTENLTAFFDFAERLAKAKTLEEVTDLHARFVTERLESVTRQSTELLTLAQRLASLPVAPLCGARAA